jgi:hypothetical protein
LRIYCIALLYHYLLVFVLFAPFCGHIKIYFPAYPCLVALKVTFGQLHVECHGIAAVRTGFVKIIFRVFKFGGF